ncbi:uncharacterized protein [Typha latifolia]|uniref:uncharacterized protein n=1 Tax=Typha latifolia TaxID=4733 RepID=UPI003C2EA6DD
MASLLSSTTLLLLLLFFHITLSLSLSPSSSTFVSQSQKSKLSNRKGLLTSKDEDDKPISVSKSPPLKKKAILEPKKNQTKPNKPISISKSPDLKKKPILETKNQTKPKKTNSTSITISSSAAKLKLTKLGKTFNSTKSANPIKSAKSNTTNPAKTQLKKPLNSTSKPTRTSKKDINLPTKNTERQPWLDESDGEDLISEFSNLPHRLQEAIVPDLERLSTTSRVYLSAANAGIANGVKPFLGNKFAPKIAPFASALFLIMPLLLLTALLRFLNSYLSLRRLLLFVQAYLAIYFATLALTALLTGFEPLRFFYATSPSSYTWTQAAQSLGYVVYLVLQMIDLVAVFSSSAGEGGRALALAQMVVGLAVGLHYYAAVFHRAVTREAPRANWRVHGMYAACFLVICACARAERRKKTYVSIGGEEDGKKS